MFSLLALLAGCGQTVLGVTILATATCDSDPCPQQLASSVPGCCDTPIFRVADGVVEVERRQIEEGAAVIFEVDIDTEDPHCPRYGTVVDEPETIYALGEDVGPLYTLDVVGGVTPVEDAPLMEEAGDTLTFEYPVEQGNETLTMREIHTVTARTPLRVEPYDDLIGCCEHVSAADVPWAAVAAMAMARRRQKVTEPRHPRRFPPG